MSEQDINFIDIIKTRRSIRKFRQKEVPDEIIDKMTEAVRWAPSWANTQCWEVIAVKDQKVKNMLMEQVKEKNPGRPAVSKAPVVFVLCAKTGVSGYYKTDTCTKFGDWFMFDLGLASQNLCLAAHESGLGTVILGYFDHDKTKQMLNVPDGYETCIIIPAGWPAQSPKPPERKETEKFVHYDYF